MTARVLIVEDERGIAMALEDDLTLEGYRVEVIGDGAAAVKRVREAAFDVILLDVMLPGKDGFEVCRELRRSGIKTPILMGRPGREVVVSPKAQRRAASLLPDEQIVPTPYKRSQQPGRSPRKLP